MEKFRKILSVALAVVFVVTLAGCTTGDVPSSTIDSSSIIDSSSNPSSSNPSSSQRPNYSIGGGGDYSTDSAKPVGPDTSTDGSGSSDGQYEDIDITKYWQGPKGYVIVVPTGNAKARESAEALKTFYTDAYGVTLSIVTDETPAVDKEMIIGKTSRRESNKNLKEGELKVSTSGEKIIFDGGHDVTVDTAVKKFIGLASAKKGVYTFSLDTGFKSTMSGGYKYVWGDEFEGGELELNKWYDTGTKMTGRDILLVESNSRTIGIKDGALRLTAYKDANGDYHVPSSVHTQSTMNYLYGYVEIRAKVPLEVGCFASFWTRSVSDSKASIAKGTLDHYAEVDMFEVFQNGGKQCIGGNILKNFPGRGDLNWYATPMDWTQQVTLTDYNYHTYGYEWTPTDIKLYFDGKLYARFDITKSWTGTSTAGMGMDGWVKNTTKYQDKSGTGMECFNEPQYLIFNHHLHIAIPDGNGGVKGFLASTSVTKNTGFTSSDYLIDYVRLYQREGQQLYTK